MSTYLLDGVASSQTLACLSQQACVALPRLPFIWASVECSRAKPPRSLTTSWGWQELAPTSWERSGACRGLLPCSSPNSPTELCLATNTFRWGSFWTPAPHHASYDWTKLSHVLLLLFFFKLDTIPLYLCLHCSRLTRCWATSPKVHLDPSWKWRTRSNRRHMLLKWVLIIWVLTYRFSAFKF